jgi:hypothetical protein
MPLGKKTRSVQYLGAIRASLKRLGLSQSVFEGRRCGVPT